MGTKCTYRTFLPAFSDSLALQIFWRIILHSYASREFDEKKISYLYIPYKNEITEYLIDIDSKKKKKKKKTELK